MKHFVARIAIVVLGASLSGAQIHAHHSFGMFDKRVEAEILVEGAVKDWQLINPHSWLFVTVTNEDGSQDEWAFEAGTTAQLIQRGITRETYRVGDSVRIIAGPSRDNPYEAMAKVVQHEDGTITIPIQTGDAQPTLDRWFPQPASP